MPQPDWHILPGEVAGPARGAERRTSPNGERSSSSKTSLSLQLQHCARVPQEQAGENINFFLSLANSCPVTQSVPQSPL